MSGCAAGIWGVCDRRDLFCVRVDLAGGFDIRPEARMTVMGFLNWWGVIVCVCTGAMIGICACIAGL